MKITALSLDTTESTETSNLDLLFSFGKFFRPNETAGWNGFIEVCTEIKAFSVSKIIPTPFIKATPSNYDTIITIMIEANRKRISNRQDNIFVTFHFPLYLKARESKAF